MSDEVKLTITEPKLFTKKAIVVLNAYALLGVIPMIVIFFISVIFNLNETALAVLINLAVLSLAVALAVYLQPTLMGNPHIRKLVGRLNLSSGVIVQLVCTPRLKSGFWAFMEDADDIGLLSLSEGNLLFKGDSVEFSFPYTQIKTVRTENVGWRGSWICGDRIRIDISDPPGERSFEFVERSSFTISKSRKITRELFNLLSAKIQK